MEPTIGPKLETLQNHVTEENKFLMVKKNSSDFCVEFDNKGIPHDKNNYFDEICCKFLPKQIKDDPLAALDLEQVATINDSKKQQLKPGKSEKEKKTLNLLNVF